MATWQLQHAKARLSEVIEDAQSKGPQIITRHGADRAVVLSIDEYQNLAPSEPRKPSSNFLHLLLDEGPKFDDGDNPFDDLRDPNDFGREIDL